MIQYRTMREVARALGQEDEWDEQIRMARRMGFLCAEAPDMFSDLPWKEGRVDNEFDEFSEQGKIGWALAKLMAGGKVSRACWREAYLWVVRIQVDDRVKAHVETEAKQGEELPIILLKDPGGQGPWEPAQVDLLASDWQEAT